MLTTCSNIICRFCNFNNYCNLLLWCTHIRFEKRIHDKADECMCEFFLFLSSQECMHVARSIRMRIAICVTGFIYFRSYWQLRGVDLFHKLIRYDKCIV